MMALLIAVSCYCAATPPICVFAAQMNDWSHCHWMMLKDLHNPTFVDDLKWKKLERSQNCDDEGKKENNNRFAQDILSRSQPLNRARSSWLLRESASVSDSPYFKVLVSSLPRSLRVCVCVWYRYVCILGTLDLGSWCTSSLQCKVLIEALA